MTDKPASLYTRLGGYDAIAAMVDDLLPRLRSDELLSRFWVSPRSLDTHNRERQLAVDFIASAAGGPTFYLGRDMRMFQKGMGITKADYAAFIADARRVAHETRRRGRSVRHRLAPGGNRGCRRQRHVQLSARSQQAAASPLARRPVSVAHQSRRGRPGQAVGPLSAVGRGRGGVQKPERRPRDPADLSPARGPR